ncbi:MAG: PAS-domain containing protein [Pseudomonadota bacterium]
MFAVAALGDRTKGAVGGRLHPIVHALGLAVFCTSWTYYGAVGTAVASGWEYAAIYAGPILAFTLGAPLVSRMVAVGRADNATSIADFIASRYGRSRRVAALVAFMAIVGSLPYVALQLRSVTAAFAAFTGGETGALGVFAVAGALAVFAILFGARNIDQTVGSNGLVAAIALDGALKIAALAAVALLAASLLGADGWIEAARETALAQPPAWGRTMLLTLLSFLAMFCLPRQFHMAVVAARDEDAARRGGRWFVIYLAAVTVFAVPIALAGAATLNGAGGPPDLYVLSLPASAGQPGLALLTFIGGVAAATGMVVVAGIALSSMAANDLITPALLRYRPSGADASTTILTVRRGVIAALLATAAALASSAAGAEQLAGLGVVSFAAAAQFAPALFAGLYWRGATAQGAIAGLSGGFVLWVLLVVGPELFPGSAVAAPGAVILSPYGSQGFDPFSVGVLFSLAVNATLVWVGSTRSRATAARSRSRPDEARGPLVVADVRSLLGRCIGPESADRALQRYGAIEGGLIVPDAPADERLARFAEVEIARAVGASSARALVKGLFTGRGVEIDDVVAMLDETSQRLEFGRELLQTTLENIAQGVSVIDEDLNVVAWNTPYLQMYAYPPGFVRVGRPISDLIRFNAERGECGPGEVDAHVERRLDRLRARRPHAHERVRPDGRVVKLEGAPVPGGGYVTSFTDVTEYKRIETALLESERSIRFYTDNIPSLIAFSNADERVMFANKAYRDQFGAPGQDIVGMRMADFQTPGAYASRKTHIERALSGRATTFDTTLTAPDDSTRAMQVQYTPQYSSNGEVLGFFGVYQDVTERRAAEQAVKEANEGLERRVTERTRALSDTAKALEEARALAEQATASKTRFLAAASHDVLQPLNAARLFASALKEDLKAGRGDADRFADKIEGSIALADKLLRSLLDVSKLDAGGMKPTITDFPLRALFDELSSEFRVIAREKNLEFRTVSTEVWVRSDRGLLLSALQNLVANAVRYTKAGRVVIGCRRRGRRVRIEVRDTGPGIAPQDRRRIFDEFERADDNAEGAGLGLAIVRRVAGLLDAEIDLVSKPPKGASFSLTIDRAWVAAPQAGAPQAAAPKRAAAGTLRDARVLCVENEAPALEAMTALLERWGAAPIPARTLAEAVAAFESGGVDLMVLDYQLDGGETGFDVIRAARAAGVAAPAILATASQSDETRAGAEALDMTVLDKPVEPASFRALAAQRIAEGRAMRLHATHRR